MVNKSDANRLPESGGRLRRARWQSSWPSAAAGFALLGLLLGTWVLTPTSALFRADVVEGAAAIVSTAHLPQLQGVGAGEITGAGAELVWLEPTVRPEMTPVYQVMRKVGSGPLEPLTVLDISAAPDGPPGAVVLSDDLLMAEPLGGCPMQWVADGAGQCYPIPGINVFYEVSYFKGPWSSAQVLLFDLELP